MNALVVVAHDDDAVLWMGGTIYHLKDWDWHIISLCNQGDSARKDYFRETCEELGAKSEALDFYDYQQEKRAPKKNSVIEMKQSLLRILGDKRYDYVFTHSRDPNGEYGYHANHREVCEVMSSLVSAGSLVDSRSRLAYFSYYPIYGVSGLPTVARKDADYYFKLYYADLAFKVALIERHIPAIVGNLEQDLGAPCPNPEAYEGDDLKLPVPFLKS
jgi:hypothetical protein